MCSEGEDRLLLGERLVQLAGKLEGSRLHWWMGRCKWAGVGAECELAEKGDVIAR